MKTKTHRLGDLQLRIMKILWQRPEATVAEVSDALGRSAKLAYTTIATMLRKMEAKGLVQHRDEGRTFVYRAAVDEHAVTRNMASDLLDKLLAGSLSSMVHHLLTTREISKEELTRLERMLAERRKK